MSDDSVELFWAAPDGVDSHAVYRFLRDDVADPDTVELSDDQLLYRGPETAYLDDAVKTGDQYWYVLFVELADGSTQQRWAIADAVTDTEPPTAVTGLTATRVGDTIELRWDQSSDNYRFERYAIRRSVDGADSIYYGTGFTIDQTSFVDDQLPTVGTVTYQLIAVDFHDNLAEATLATVNLG